MRGYSGIMTTSDSSSCSLNGDGSPVHTPNLSTTPTLWEPKPGGVQTPEPLWHLRVAVLKDQEGQGDCRGRCFAFKTYHHLTHASNQLIAAFGKACEMKKCGVDSPDAMGGRVNDGRTENITIEYDSEKATEPWQQFKSRLTALEDEWEHETSCML